MKSKILRISLFAIIGLFAYWTIYALVGMTSYYIRYHVLSLQSPIILQFPIRVSPRGVMPRDWERYPDTHDASPTPLKQTKTSEVEDYRCKDVIDQIRCIGEALGKDNHTISQMIEIARAESQFNEKAKNKTSSAAGVFQIISSTWKHNKCDGDIFKAEDNIRCAYKIQERSGFNQWEVFINGVAKI